MIWFKISHVKFWCTKHAFNMEDSHMKFNFTYEIFI